MRVFFIEFLNTSASLKNVANCIVVVGQPEFEGPIGKVT